MGVRRINGRPLLRHHKLQSLVRKPDAVACVVGHQVQETVVCGAHDVVPCSADLSKPHVAHCKMLIALLVSVIEFIDTNLTEISS